MYLSISCWWSLQLFWYFGTIVINEVEFGAAALTIKDHMFPIKLQIIRIMCPIREVKLPPLPTTYFHQVETLFSLRCPVCFPHLGFPAQRSALLQLPSPPLQIFPHHLPSLFNFNISSKCIFYFHKFTVSFDEKYWFFYKRRNETSVLFSH